MLRERKAQAVHSEATGRDASQTTNNVAQQITEAVTRGTEIYGSSTKPKRRREGNSGELQANQPAISGIESGKSSSTQAS